MASVNNRASDQSLYVFFLGANWVNDAFQEELDGEPCSVEDPNVCPGRHAGTLKLSGYLNELKWSVKDLIDAGAHNFLVINTNSLSTSPAFREVFPDYLEEVNAYALDFNHELYRTTKDLLSAHDIELQYFDLYSLHEHMTAHPEYFQLSNVDEYCGMYNFSVQVFEYEAHCSEETISEYLYYDGIHWTSAAHKPVAEFIYMEALGIAPAKPEIISKAVNFEAGDADFQIEASDDTNSVEIQFQFAEHALENVSENQWTLHLSDMDPGFYPYSVVLKNEVGATSRSYGDYIYYCEEKTLDQFVASGQVNFNPGSRWFWFSTPGEYVIASSGLKVGDEGDGNELLRLVPFFGIWAHCPG